MVTETRWAGRNRQLFIPPCLGRHIIPCQRVEATDFPFFSLFFTMIDYQFCHD